MMINRALKEYINVIPEKAIMHDWWITLISSAFGIIDYIQEPTILYRQHTHQDIGIARYSIKNIYSKFIKNPKNAISSFYKTIEQAKDFLKIYKDVLSQQQIDLLTSYINLSYSKPKDGFKNIVKYKFFKQDLLINIGFIITVLINNYKKQNT